MRQVSSSYHIFLNKANQHSSSCYRETSKCKLFSPEDIPVLETLLTFTKDWHPRLRPQMLKKSIS